MVEPAYVSAVQAISWIAFGDFGAIEKYLPEYYGTRGMAEYGVQDINRGNNKIIRAKIENAKKDLLEHLRARNIDLWGYQKNGDNRCELIPLAYLLHDNLDFAIACNELWFRQRPFDQRPTQPDWERLKIERKKILKTWPEKQSDLPAAQTRTKLGRKPGSGIKKLDEPFVLKMRERIVSGRESSPHAAAVQVSAEIKHSQNTKPESITKRLMIRYGEMFSDNSEE